MTNQQAIANTPSDSVDYDKVTDEIFSCVNNHLILLIDQMVNTADKKLFDLSEKALTDEDRMKYMDCTRIFRTEKNDISGKSSISCAGSGGIGISIITNKIP
jgi:hypothetical protein